MIISKVKLKKGNRGLVVWYVNYEDKEGLTFVNEYPGVGYNFPVNRDLFSKFRDFEGHVYDIMGIGNRSGVTVNGVHLAENGISLLCSYEPIPLCVCALNTPYVKDIEQYIEFDLLAGQVRDLFGEVGVYTKGSHGVDQKQYVIDFYAGKGSYNEEDIEAMSNDERRVLMIEALEKTGAIVVDPQRDLVGEDEGLMKVV